MTVSAIRTMANIFAGITPAGAFTSASKAPGRRSAAAAASRATLPASVRFAPQRFPVTVGRVNWLLGEKCWNQSKAIDYMHRHVTDRPVRTWCSVAPGLFGHPGQACQEELSRLMEEHYRVHICLQVLDVRLYGQLGRLNVSTLVCRTVNS